MEYQLGQTSNSAFRTSVSIVQCGVLTRSNPAKMELSGEGVDLADMEYVVINQGKDASSATLARKEKGVFINDIDIEPGKIWTVDYNSSTKV